MRNFSRMILVLFLAIPAMGAEYHLQLTPDTTKVQWTLGDVLHTVHGTFKLKRGDIRFDPETGKASGEAVVDTTSGNSGSGARDGRMNKNVLESDKYPEAVFTPDQVEGKLELEGPSNIQLHGSLKIHGATHEIMVPVQVLAKEGALTASLKFDVPYVAWGMKDPSTFILKVSKSVALEIQTTGHVAPARVAAR